ncbi:MAG TPA: transcriptional regulator [Candidatus Polarisedimenticolia bacterium]|nr:transcriptional regulator [Candidatus Polarisedimenticolia bacterium]
MGRSPVSRRAPETERKSVPAPSAPRARALQLDRIIPDRIRLGILSALATHPTLAFNELKEMLDTSDGNLSVHARKLEEVRYITVRKSFAGRIPRTEFKLTDAGRKALESYLGHMEALIQATRSS